MEVINILVATWVDTQGTWESRIPMPDGKVCGDVIGIMYQHLYALYEDSMMQCVDTLIPAYSPTPTLRSF